MHQKYAAFVCCRDFLTECTIVRSRGKIFHIFFHFTSWEMTWLDVMMRVVDRWFTTSIFHYNRLLYYYHTHTYYQSNRGSKIHSETLNLKKGGFLSTSSSRRRLKLGKWNMQWIYAKKKFVLQQERQINFHCVNSSHSPCVR